MERMRRMACFKKTTGRPVKIAPASAPPSQQHSSETAACHQRARKKAMMGSTHKYQVPWIHVERAMAAVVKMTLRHDGATGPERHHEISTTMHMASVNSRGRA